MGSDLTEGDIYSTIYKTASPMVVAFMLHSAFNIIDAYFVGKISSEALAAVSISFPVIFLIISIGTGVGSGATSVISRFIGAKEFKKADNAAEHALLAALVLGLMVGVLGFVASPTLFDVIGASGSLKSAGLGYLNILLFFSVFMMLAFVGNSILRGEGDMKTPMYVMVLSTLLNIFLDPVFIFYLGLGVEGAAWATVLSRTVGMLYLAYHMLSGRSWFRLDFRKFKYDFDYVSRIFKVGIPSSLINVTMSFGMLLWTIIVGIYGTNALAAFGIGFRLDTLALLPGLGVSVAVISIVGQCVGAGKMGRAREVTLKAGLIASALMSLIGLVFFVFAEYIVSFFNDNPQVLRYGVAWLRIIPFSYLVVGISMSISGAFIGSGRALFAFVVTLFRVVVFSVPLAYILSVVLGKGVPGIWMGIMAASYLGFVVSIVLFRYGGWDRSTC